MTKYFVDYENVHIDGLKGILRLTEEDTVIIFYSEKADTMSFGLHKRINSSKANFEYRKVTVGTPNALDFQLASFVGYEIAQNDNANIVIVSKDKGYDGIVNFWNKSNKCKISRVEDISCDVNSTKETKETATEEKEITINEIVKNIGTKNSEYAPKIYEALKNRKSKAGIHNYLMKEIHENNKVTELYLSIKPLLKDKS